jgi:hypothetical protein
MEPQVRNLGDFPAHVADDCGIYVSGHLRQQNVALGRRQHADIVRFGMPLEIYNPAWGTVIDGVDPTIFPSRDPRDGRRGALIHQYIPLSNEQQLWQLRRRKASPTAPTPVTPNPEPLSK